MVAKRSSARFWTGRGAAGKPEPEAAGAWHRRRDRLASWSVSVALHVVVLLLVAAVTWLSRPEGHRGAPREREAAIVLPSDAASVAGGPAGAVRLEPFAGRLVIPRLEDSPQVEPAWDVSASSPSPSKLEPIISIDVGSGGSLPQARKDDWTDFAAGGGGSGAGGASFFGLEARGERFVFVVDRSGSMGGEKLDAAKAELLRAVRGLKRDAKFYTIFFNDHEEPMPARDLVRATEANKRGHFTWVSGIRADDGTDPTSAMIRALGLKPDAIWLLSDGIFEGSAADAIQRANPGRKVQIHAIAFYSREGEAVLKRIAKDNRGRYRFVSPASIGLGAGR